MSKLLRLFVLGLLLCLSSAATANEIFVYKYASTRPWSQYDCRNPDSTSAATPPIAKTPLAGTYTVTEYWVFDRTDMNVGIVSYYSYVWRGITLKEYRTLSLWPLTGIRTPMWIKTNATNTYNMCWSDGYYTVFNDSVPNYGSCMEMNMTGTAKPYTVITGFTFDAVATSLSGDWVRSYRSESNDGSSVTNRTLYFESGTQSLTLDAALTKTVNTTGQPGEIATLDWGLKNVRLALEKLGYDEYVSP